MKFSANLGFLWSDIPLPDAIRAAAQAGFDAVECHWPYETVAEDVAAALSECGLAMLGLNTVRGDTSNGENGLLALPGREAEAQDAILQAIAYADAIDAGAIHLMAGVATGDDAQRAFESNLRFAAGQTNRTLLIEPLNAFDAPGYFLRDTGLASEIIIRLQIPQLKLMFDCYHVARTEGDVLAKLAEHASIIGHIQFAGVPDRGRPDVGVLDYAPIFRAIEDMGWISPLGAEYKPGGPTEETLGWMQRYSS